MQPSERKRALGSLNSEMLEPRQGSEFATHSCCPPLSSPEGEQESGVVAESGRHMQCAMCFHWPRNIAHNRRFMHGGTFSFLHTDSTFPEQSVARLTSHRRKASEPSRRSEKPPTRRLTVQ